jgi:hypothetical protein
MKSISYFVIFFVLCQTAFSQTENIKLPIKTILSYKANMVSPQEHFIVSSSATETKIVDWGNKSSNAITTFEFQTISNRPLLAAASERLWVIDKREMIAYSTINKEKIGGYPTPSGSKFIAVQVGYDHALFCLDSSKNQIYRWHNGKWKVLLESAEIKHATCLLLRGPQLFIGTINAIKILNIGNAELSKLADNVPNTKAMAFDHEGHLLALSNIDITRYHLNGEKTVLQLEAKNYTALQFDVPTHQLLLVKTNNEIENLDYFEITKTSANAVALKNKKTMQPFANKEIQLVGSEYLYFTLDKKGALVEEVNDGFYPEKGVYLEGEAGTFTPNAKVMACAEQSYAAFKTWCAQLPKAFMATTKNTPPLFWLMVNDYSGIETAFTEKSREASLWYWKREPAIIGRVPGYWKWEATLTQFGQCDIPNAVEAQKYLEEYLKK